MRRTWASIALFALALGACTSPADPESLCPPADLLREGDRLPECTFPLIGGGELALADLEGRPTVLNFWASWCLACLKEMPELDRFQDDHPELRVLGVNTMINGETPEAGETYYEERGVRYESLVDPAGDLFGHFSGNQVLPLTVIVDADRVVRGRHFGEVTAGTLEAKLDEALG